jgi:hypothetical protein
VYIKAAYRFLDNADIHEDVVLKGHFDATCERVVATTGPAPILHDTAHFKFQRDNAQPIGITHKTYVGKDEEGQHKARALCGILMHSSWRRHRPAHHALFLSMPDRDFGSG